MMQAYTAELEAQVDRLRDDNEMLTLIVVNENINTPLIITNIFNYY